MNKMLVILFLFGCQSCITTYRRFDPVIYYSRFDVMIDNYSIKNKFGIARRKVYEIKGKGIITLLLLNKYGTARFNIIDSLKRLKITGSYVANRVPSTNILSTTRYPEREVTEFGTHLKPFKDGQWIYYNPDGSIMMKETWEKDSLLTGK